MGHSELVVVCYSSELQTTNFKKRIVFDSLSCCSCRELHFFSSKVVGYFFAQKVANYFVTKMVIHLGN